MCFFNSVIGISVYYFLRGGFSFRGNVGQKRAGGLNKTPFSGMSTIKSPCNYSNFVMRTNASGAPMSQQTRYRANCLG